MVIALSNLILLLPVAFALAVILSMASNPVMRPRQETVRTVVLIFIWQFAILGMVGFLMRASWLSLLWIVILIVFLIHLWFWERGLARNILLLVFGVNSGSPNQLNKLVHYLQKEGRGYWRRLGIRFGKVWKATGDWQFALLRTRLARPTRARLALASLANQPDEVRFRQQLSQAVHEHHEAGRWLGRMVAVSLSLFMLSASGVIYEMLLGPTFNKMWEEFEHRDLTKAAYVQPWLDTLKWKLHIIVPVTVWLILILFYVTRKFSWIARRWPIAWLLRHYYRALAMEGLADGLKSSKDPSVVCLELAKVMPVPGWQRRLRSAHRKLVDGQALSTALKSSGLLRPREAATLALCRTPETLSWTIHELSQSLLQRTMNRTHVLIQILTVVLTIFTATITCLYAISTFGFLVKLIESQI